MSDTVDTVATAVRFIADDQEGDWLDTALQLASINMGWREVQRRLLLAGSPIMQKTVVLTVPNGTSELSATSTPALPTDFFMPHILEERPTGSPSNIDYSPMEEQRWPQGIPPREALRAWSWEGGVITFVGATRDVDVRMEYARTFDSFTDPEDEIPIPFVVDAIAWAVLFTVALARGSADSYRDRCSAMCDAQLSLMAQMHVKRDQYRRIHRPQHHRGRF